MLAKASVVLFSAAVLAAAAEIVPPAPALERDGPAAFLYRTNPLATGKGELAVKWTDAYGRVVEEFKLPVELNDENEIGFTLDLRRAAAMRNQVEARFTFEGVNKKGDRIHRDETAQAGFIARPPDRAWWDYVILMWQNYSAVGFAALKNLGISAGQYNGRNRTPPEFLLRNDLRWYAENIATDFYSAYHRYFGDRPNHWAFLQAKELYKKDPASKEAFKRHPSFEDAEWVRRVRERLVESARQNSPYRPVFYSLGDESGIADLAAYWDFDFSDQSLAAMRGWLKERYGTLAALNRQWGTSFTAWDLVTPDTTNEAMRRADENYSSWSDFKEWMDISYARALKMGVDAVRSVDPEAHVGIGGAQMPGWGGYDYWRLSQTLTAVEPYDIGNNIEILRSVNPALPVVTTAFARGPAEKHRVWYELLHGNRGLLIWDDKNEMVTRAGQVNDRGREVEPYYTELRGGIATLLMNSERRADPIAIHYSQASMRAEWMLAQRPKGAAWVDRGSSRERMDSEFLRLRESWCRLIEDLGLQYNFVAYAQIEQGELLKRGYRVLVLPRSTALSAAEARAIAEFVRQGGRVIADGVPGAFDEHCRRLARPQLQDAFDASEGRAGLIHSDTLNYHQNRLVGKEGAVHEMAGKLMKEAGVAPEYAAVDEAGKPIVGVETHTFRNGAVTIIGLLENPQTRVNELGPPEFKSNERFEKPRAVRLVLPDQMYGYDVRTGKELGRQKQVSLTLDPFEPTVFAFSRTPLAALRVAAPARLARGETGRIGLALDGTPAARSVLHVDVIDPAGKVLPHYSGNVLAEDGRAAKLLPVAMNDAVGKWQVRVRDVFSGHVATATVEVY